MVCRTYNSLRLRAFRVEWCLVPCSNPSLSIVQSANELVENAYMSLEKWRVANSATVLLLFRDGIASDWASLCYAFDLNPNRDDTPVNMLRRIVRELVRAKLLVANKDFDSEGSIKVSDNVPEFLAVLNLSLKEMAATNPRRS